MFQFRKKRMPLGLVVGIGIGTWSFSLTSKDLNDGFAGMFYHADRYATDIFVDHGSQTRKIFGEMMLSILPISCWCWPFAFFSP